MVSNATQPRRTLPPILAGLLWTPQRYVLFGDPDRRPVIVAPRRGPIIIHEIDTQLRYEEFVRAILAISPNDANAFAIGMPVYRYKDQNCIDAAVQFYDISQDDFNRSWEYRLDTYTLKQYLVAQSA